jgi:hypothetical protein
MSFIDSNEVRNFRIGRTFDRDLIFTGRYLALGDCEEALSLYRVEAGEHAGRYLLHIEDQYGHISAELCKTPDAVLERLVNGIVWTNGGREVWHQACENDPKLSAIECEDWTV